MATSTTANFTKSSSKVLMTPNKLTELKKGPKTNIMIGPEGNRFIGLEGASVNLLAHFSPYAQKKLAQNHGNVLYIPNGSKNAIVWIYKYMQASEADAEHLEAFADLTFDRLVLIYQHCAFLEYESLMARSVGRLKGKFYNSLPSVDEIKMFATSVPPMYAFSVDCLAKEMVSPWTCNYLPYLELAESDRAFGDALKQGIQGILADQIKSGEEYYQRTTNREVLWSRKYLDSRLSVAKSRVTSTSTKPAKKDNTKADSKKTEPVHPKTNTNTIAHNAEDARDLPTTSSPEASKQNDKAKKAFKCYKCGGEGHIARNCNTGENPDTTATEPPASVDHAENVTAESVRPSKDSAGVKPTEGPSTNEPTT